MSADLATRPDTEVRIADVIVGDRARKDYGDLTSLMESIREHGVLQPIGVLPGNRLLFGGRRLEACRLLGHESIAFTRPTTRDDALALLRAERDENTCRKDMTPEELVDVGLKIEEIERPSALARQGARTDLTSGPSGPEVSPAPHGNRTAQVVGDALGLSRNTYKRAKHVVESARGKNMADPDVQAVAQGALDDMNSGVATVTGAYNKVRKARGAAEKPSAATPIDEPKRPGPKPTRHVIKVANIRRIVTKVSGYHEALEDVTEIDPALTSEEAAHITGDLSKSIAALQRLNRLIKERTK